MTERTGLFAAFGVFYLLIMVFVYAMSSVPNVTEPSPVMNPDTFFTQCIEACGDEGVETVRTTRQIYESDQAVVQECTCRSNVCLLDPDFEEG